MNKVLFFIPFLLITCDRQKVNDSPQGDTGKGTVYEHNVYVGDSLDSDRWDCKTLANERICYPSLWTPISQKSYLFFAYVDTSKKHEFFVVGKYNMDSLNISESDFLRETYRQLSADTQEVLIGYDLKKLIFAQNHAYYAEYFTEIEGEKYSLFSMTFPLENLLYDLTLKVESSEDKGYRDIYRYLLYNFQVDNQYLFEEEDKILEFRKIDPSSL